MLGQREVLHWKDNKETDCSEIYFWEAVDLNIKQKKIVYGGTLARKL
jgi:hypothetical protein